MTVYVVRRLPPSVELTAATMYCDETESAFPWLRAWVGATTAGRTTRRGREIRLEFSCTYVAPYAAGGRPILCDDIGRFVILTPAALRGARWRA